ncbi:Pfs, NACHT and Ankyrin domain protein [Tolypocladium paradoxum]|uniref:Pfs, NACHT and Ankyrin domain protein n=1 Tax=Tolypocladium paradoxum TaxID=94208 RepID=A0A2S4L0N0_9HYPO|nr:Pfs, NACHT and Ankyrin domain protein [Tolypocladium paradoxum]
MDPESLASNTAALLGLTIQVTGSLYGTWDEVNQPVVNRLLYELGRLRSVLSSLEEASLQSVDPVLPDQLPRVFRALREALVSLASKILGDVDPSQSLSQLIWEACLPGREPRSLSLSRSESEDLFNELQVQTANLRKAKDYSLVSVPVDSSRIEAPEGLVSLGLWKDCAEYNGLHAAAQNNRVKGSGMWLLSHADFRRWMTTERIDYSGQDNVLYCVGRPGSGKTILASSIVIDEVKSIRRDTATNFSSAYFYFSYQAQTPIYAVVLALIEQLYLQSPTATAEVRELEKRTTKQEPTEIPLAELITVLISVAARFRRSYIVLDALDECSSAHRADLAALIGSIRSSQCRLFVTARPSHGLSEFDKCPRIAIAPSAEDMTLFVRARLQCISAQRPIFSKEQKSQIVDALVKMGSQHGIFLLVELQINCIAKSFEHGVVDSFKLEDSLKMLTGELDKVYDDQINRISSQHEADSKLAKHILSWLYYNTGSMKAVELEDILRREVEAWEAKPTAAVDIRFIRKVCFDLVQFNPDVKTISFFHFSFHEYLETKHGSQMGVPAPEMVLAEACMKYLLRPELSSPVGTPERLDERFQSFPFYKYSALNWSRFLRQDDKLDFATPMLRSLLTDSNRMLAISEAVFRDEPTGRFWKASVEKKGRPLHFIVYFGLLRRATGVPGYLTSDINETDFLGRSAVHIAAMMGNSEAMEVLLTDANLEKIRKALTLPNSLGKNAWHYVASGNYCTVANILLGKFDGVEVEHNTVATEDSDGMTPLTYAASRGHAEILSLFLEKGIHNNDTDEALRAAAHGGHERAIMALLSHGVMPKQKHLLAAIDSGAENTVRLLLEYGVDINGKADGLALHEATQSGKKPIMSSLIWNGADLETIDSASRTPLSIAVENGDTGAVRALLKAGSNPDVVVPAAKSPDGETSTVSAISWAARHGMTEIFSLLRQAGTDTSLSVFPALENGQYDIVYELLASGTASELLGDQRTNAVSLARDNGYEDVADLIQNWDVIRSDPAWGYASREETHQQRKQRIISRREPDISSSVQVPSSVAVEEVPAELATAVTSSPRSPPSLTVSGGSASGTSVTYDAALGGEARGASRTKESDPNQKNPYPVRISSKSRPQTLNRTPYILLESPIVEGCIELGSLVRDPRRPLDSFAPTNSELLRQTIPATSFHVLGQDYFEMQRGRSRKAATGISILGGGQASIAKNSSLRIQSRHVWRRQIRNHLEVLNILFQNDALMTECVNLLHGKKEVYMMVGFFIMDRSRVAYEDDKDSATSFSFPLGLVPTGLGIESPTAPMAGDTKSEMLSVRYNERLVHGIQYRVLRMKKSVLDTFRSETKRALNVELGEYVAGSAYDGLF